jgi:hypothetical protein
MRAQKHTTSACDLCSTGYRGRKRLSRAVCAADTTAEARRPVGGHTPVSGAGSGGWLDDGVAGVLVTAATWVASTGNRAAVSSWCCGRE